MSIRNEIMKLISNKGCGVLDMEELTEQQTLAHAGLDSLRFMEFVVLFEETFGFEFPDEYLDISMETTIGDLARIADQVNR